VKATRHLVYDHHHYLVDVAMSGCRMFWAVRMEEGFTLQCLGCWKVDCLTAEITRLTDIVKGMEMKMIKGSVGIVRDDRKRGWNEQCCDKKTCT